MSSMAKSNKTDEVPQAKPFVKWLGGKSKSVLQIAKRMPNHINTYIEPFVGGGFMLFWLSNHNRFDHAVISDNNPELINAYMVIKHEVEFLIKELSKSKYVYDKDSFLKIRALEINNMSDVERAARFIYLNKTCFNGLYRVNKSGGFNTPFGKFSNPTILDVRNLRAVNVSLKKVRIIFGDFESSCSFAKKGDCVYFDPPYIPISKTSNFTSYTSEGFNLQSHIRLRNLFRDLSKKDIRVLLSNSKTEITMNLYEDFDYDIIDGSRSISGPAEHRNSVEEVLVFAGGKS